MGRVNEPWQLFLAYGLVYGIGIAAISNLPVGVLISRWFYRRRGAAVSAAISGGAFGQLVIIGVLSAFLASMGWRAAFTALGFVTLAVLAPVVLTTVRSRPPLPTVEPRLGESYAVGEKAASARAEPLLDEALPLRMILRSRQFALLLTMYGICGFQDFFVATHLVAFAQDQGVGSVLAGSLLAWMGLMGLVGVLLSGVLSDAFGAARPTLLCFLLRIVIFGFIIYSQDTVAVAAFALVYGFTFLVTAPLTVVFAGAIFGQGRLGLVAGSISMIHQISGGLGALAGALIFDQWGSYDRAFLLLLVISVAAVPVTLMLRERPLALLGTTPADLN
jgi:MFS family permease